MTTKGTFISYIDWKPGADTLKLVAQVNQVADEYEAKGFVLTLRQLYYQLVAKGLIENTEASYNRIGRIVSDGRMAGMVSWTAIEDRGRFLRGFNTYDNVAHFLDSVKKDYRIDRWQNQKFRPEVWIEKEALVDVIGSICNELRVDYFACKGYNSQSEQWRAGRRMAQYVRKGQTPIVFHLGDHDPSGIDMTRDNQERLSLFAGVPVQVVRIALNMPQVEQYNPPPNPAKVTDSRFEAYLKAYGEESWELDALSPETIHGVIRDSIMRIRDQAAWNEMEAQENEDLRALEIMIDDIEPMEDEE